MQLDSIDGCTRRGYSVAEVADRLGTTTDSLYAWKKKYGPDSTEHLIEADTTAHRGTEDRATWNKGAEGVRDQIKDVEASPPFDIQGFGCGQ